MKRFNESSNWTQYFDSCGCHTSGIEDKSSHHWGSGTEGALSGLETLLYTAAVSSCQLRIMIVAGAGQAGRWGRQADVV